MESGHQSGQEVVKVAGKWEVVIKIGEKWEVVVKVSGEFEVGKNWKW
jgi:hypothetical protein